MRTTALPVWLAVWLAGSSAAHARPADWAPQRDAFDPQVIARYEHQLSIDPFDARTLAKLARLFTGRHTAAELEQRLGDDDPAALIARAQLHRTRADLAGALALYERATALEPEGPFAAKTWLAIGQLHRDRGELDAARDAYEHVLAVGPPTALAVAALHPLADLAAIAKQPVAETYFVELLALSPDDPDLWLAHGDAIVGREPRIAADSFARAEQLVVHDLPRRIDAITRRADACERAGDPAAAQAELWRAIGVAPKPSYLVPDLLARLIGVARRAKELPALRAKLVRDWPEPARGYLEWSTLGELAKELGDRETALVELQRAARLAPWELATQHTVIELLAAAGRDPRDQLRAAIRAAPSEPTLQLELARRTWPSLAALDMLDRTAQQFSRDASVVISVAHQFLGWNQPARAERWLEAAARLEPDDDDHWLELVDAYFAADDHRGAVAAWRRVSHPRPGAMLRFAGTLLDEHDHEQANQWIDASIAIDGLNPEAWRLRAEADEARGDFTRAIEDALRELSLTRPDRAALRHAQHHVVHVLEKSRPTVDHTVVDIVGSLEPWDSYLNRWHDALWAKTPDIDAGYLYIAAMADYSCETDPVLSLWCPGDVQASAERLVALVPDDLDLLRTVIHMYQEEGMDRAAEASLEKLLALDPRAATEIREELGRVRTAAIAVERDTPRDHPWRGGLAIDYGATLHGSLGGSIGLGAFGQRAFGTAEDGDFNVVEGRVDWNQAVTTEAAALAAGLWRHFDAFSAASLAVGVDERAELRFGDPKTGTALATDLSAILGLHEAPLDLGVRVEQWYAGSSATRALLEIRVRLF